MEEIKIIDSDQDKRWDEFVENHASGRIVHLSGWKKVIEQTFPHIKGHHLALIDTETNQIKAGLPIYEIRSWLTGNRLVSIPFASLCDPLVSNKQQFKTLLDKTTDFAVKRNLKLVNIRFFQSGIVISNMEGHISTLFKTHQLQIQNDPEETKKTFNRNIKRIIKTFNNGELTLQQSNNEQNILIFHYLYTKTRKRLGLPTQPSRLLKNLFQEFSPKNQISLLIANSEEKPIGGLIVFKYKNRVSSEFLASEIVYRHLNTDHFLYWNAIRIACEEGYKTYDFGRTAIDNVSLDDFKKRWGTTELPLPEYYNSQNSPKEESLVKYNIIRKLCKSSPDLVYQKISSFCYKHLG